MTERLYYQDAYATTFRAWVVEHIRSGDDLAVVLDKTCFYPTSGGQPCDTGTISGVRVVDVSIREKDGAIIHQLADEIWDDEVEGKIDWPRRFDHMQQHTGQHILSAAFVMIARAETVGFHLGAESCTIDLDARSLAPALLEQVEDLANKVIHENRAVRSTILTPQQVAQLPLRKRPPVEGPVRLIDVERFDMVACGGTHVRQAGEIGVIKIVRLEGRGKGLRVEFRCGQRALLDYRFKNDLVNRIANEFTVGQWEVDQAIDRLREEARALRSENRRAKEQLLEFEARELLRAAEYHGNLRLVSAVYTDRDRQEINWLVKALTDHPSVVVLFGLAGDKSHILFARSEDVDRDMVLLLKTALRVLGSAAGGGRPQMAQGGGPPADENRVEQAIDRAKRLLLAQR